MCDWTQGLPTQQGVYAVCGYGLGDRKATAVVEVRQHDGELYSNLHRENSGRDMDEWHPVAEHSDRFFWCRLSDLPPSPPNIQSQGLRHMNINLCTWTQDSDDGSWDTECGQKHQFFDGTPHDNNHAYCPYCGATLATAGPEHPSA